MRITGGSGARYHPNTGVKSGHASSMSRMGQNEVRMTLFSPKAFQVGTSGNSGIGFGVHTGEMGNNKTIDKNKSR